MNSHVKDAFSSMNGICDDDNVLNVLYLSWTINTISNSEEFSFSGYYIYIMMNFFDNNILIFTNIQNWYGHFVLNTSIRDNKYYVLISKRILIDGIKFVIMSSFCISIFSVNWIKRKTIRKSIYQTKSKRKFSI